MMSRCCLSPRSSDAALTLSIDAKSQVLKVYFDQPPCPGHSAYAELLNLLNSIPKRMERFHAS